MKSLSLFSAFFRIGAFTIGGGYAMIPLIQREIVDNQHWLDEEEFLNMIALAQAAPGVIAVNSAIFIGYRIDGWRGLLASVLGAVLPSFVIILALALAFQQFRDNEYVERFFLGLRPAVVALIASPVFKLAKSARLTRYNIWIPITAALLIWLVGLNPIYVILIAGIGGYAYGQYIKD